MGHHAQYRKRFSTHTGSTNPLTPPAPAEWEVRFNLTQIESRFVVALPAGATYITYSYQLHGGEWTQDGIGSIINAWHVTLAAAPSGTYYVRAAWTNSNSGVPAASDWSDAKAVIVP